MAHQSLYRRYRPQTFADLVGQQHIVRTLRNAIAENSVAHAYLFTGPRGTGKTTTARILAKALECEQGPTPDPDATCEQCVQIAEGNHPDVLELDAASRTGVDAVREEIINRVDYAPTRGAYKIYIIDEVHMLSASAFNALLKTIEEPPSHVVFILCTTHAHKVPETIHSRCQRFDFHRIGVDDIVSRLRFISDEEKIEVPDAALALIARHAAGGMRDAVTTLEQLAAFTSDKITLDDVAGLLGEVNTEELLELADLIERRDIAGLFRYVAALVETGADLAEFVRALTGHMRDLYVITAAGTPEGIVDAAAEDLPRLETQAAGFGGERLARVLDLLGELGAEMRWSADPRLSLEVALTRMARPQGELTLDALAERVAALEAGVPASVTRAATQPASAPVAAAPAANTPAAAKPAAATAPAAAPPAPPAAEPEPEAAPEAAPVAQVRERAAAAGPLERAQVKRAWPGVLAELRKRMPARATAFGNVEIDIDADGSTVVVEFPRDQKFTMDLADEPDAREALRRALADVLGGPVPFRYQLGRGPVRNEPREPGPAASAPAPAPVPADRPAPAPATDIAEPPVSDDAPGVHEPELADADSTPDLEHLLVHGLGAQILAEHPHTDTDGKDD